MPSAAALRLQIENALSKRIPSALTPAARVMRPTAPTGIAALDERLGGGLPVGALSELTGPECSGRSSLALSFVAGLTEAGRVCAWVDVSDALDPESAAAAGVDLERLLWVRCGARQLALPGMAEGSSGAKAPEIFRDFSARLKPGPFQHEPQPGSFKHEPRPGFRKIAEGELDRASGQASVSAIDTNSRLERNEFPQSFVPRCAEPQPRALRKSREVVVAVNRVPHICPAPANVGFRAKPVFAAERPLAVREYSRLDQALRVTDLLLQAGGFSAIVLDMGGVSPEFALRVPLATWFRYRAAAERTQASVVLLTQQACTKSSAGVVLTLTLGGVTAEGGTVLTGAEYRVEIARERFAQAGGLARKPPQSVRWEGHAPWAGRR